MIEVGGTKEGIGDSEGGLRVLVDRLVFDPRLRRSDRGALRFGGMTPVVCAHVNRTSAITKCVHKWANASETWATLRAESGERVSSCR